MSTTAKLFQNGNSQAIRLPRAFRLPGKEVRLSREGEKLIIEPLTPTQWPAGFFKKIKIKDRGFDRPAQGDLPPLRDLGA